MSKEIVINGNTYEPSSVVAKRFGYTLDYVSRLARQGKVDATRVGRQWFVEEGSLRAFVLESDSRKKATREQLRRERKHEHQEFQEKNGVSIEKVTHPIPSPLRIDEAMARVEVRSGDFFSRAQAVVGSALVICAGLLVGALLRPADFLALVAPATEPIAHFSQTARERNSAGSIRSTDVLQTQPQPVLAEPEADRGMIVWSDETDERDLEQVRRSFSDEVEVEFTNDDSGVITPVFKDRTGAEYQFLMVPVRDSS